MIDYNLDFFNNIDKYINYIQSSILYLFKLRYIISKFYIILILFKNLFNFYNNFYFKKYKNISQNIKNININKFISDIINKSAKLGSNISNSINKINNKKSKYYIYYKNKNFNSKNYLKKDCFFKYPKLKPNNNNNNNNNNKTDKINKIKNKKFKSIKNNNNKYKNESIKAIIKIKSIKFIIIIYKFNINNINNINKN